MIKQKSLYATVFQDLYFRLRNSEIIWLAKTMSFCPKFKVRTTALKITVSFVAYS